MKNTRIILTVIFITLCLLLVGCESDGSNDRESSALCDHDKAEWVLQAEADGFNEGEEALVCEACGEALEHRKLPRIASVGLAYTVNDDGETCTITGRGACGDRDISIPEEIDGYRVVAIRNSAFRVRGEGIEMERLYIPGTVKTIGPYAFQRNEKLKAVYISDGVTRIDGCAFGECFALEDVRLPSDLEVIENGVFEYCKSLKNIVLPDSVTVIGQSAFQRCENLEGIIIPDSVKRIESMAFINCEHMKTVELGDGLEVIEDGVFEYCGALSSIELPDSVKYLGGRVFAECLKLSEVVLPEGIESIGGGLFYNCASLKSITIPQGVIVVEQQAFSGCASLSSIEIPSTVICIDNDAFEDCSSLQFNQYNGALYLGNEEDPYTVLALVEDKSVASLDVHPDTKVIYHNAFQNCAQLKKINLPDGLISVGSDVLVGCDRLEYSVYKGGRYLGNEKNPYLLFVDIEDSSMTSVEIHPDTKILGNGSFRNCVMTSVKLPEGLKSINAFAFSGQYRLLSVEIPNQVTYVGEHAFSGCSKLESVAVPGSVRYMGSLAFSHCDKLESVELLDGITEVGGWFYRTPLKTLTIPGSVEKVWEIPVEGLGEGKRLETIIYKGSTERWNEIYTDWDSLNVYMEYLRVKLVCSNGEVLIGGGWNNIE